MSSVTKVCKRCHTEKTIEEFDKATNGDRLGLKPYCRLCNSEYMKAYYEKNREKASSRGKAYYRENRERILAYLATWKETSEGRRKIRARNLKVQYGITIEDYELLLAEQNGVCAVCGLPEKSNRYSRLAVDHCHDSGKVRGLLCNVCNRMIGLAKDDPGVLIQAVRYLTENRGGIR